MILLTSQEGGRDPLGEGLWYEGETCREVRGEVLGDPSGELRRGDDLRGEDELRPPLGDLRPVCGVKGDWLRGEERERERALRGLLTGDELVVGVVNVEGIDEERG